MTRTIPPFSFRFLVLFFIAVVTTLCLFSSGTIESEDGWLYLSVAKNIYYEHRLESIPDYYPLKNVHMNSLKGADGKWRAPGSLGYSLSLVPAVALSDLAHRIEHSSPATYFPLEHDWSLHFFASFTNCVWTGVLSLVLLGYILILTGSKKTALIWTILTIFGTNIFPLSKFSFAHMMFTVATLSCFFALKLYFTSRKKRFVLFFVTAFLLMVTAYNVSYYIPLFPLMIYALLLQPKEKWKQSFLVGLLLLLPEIVWKRQFLLTMLSSLPLTPWKVLFEGVWGFLFSPGKSIFLYSPLLVLPFIFWHRLQKKHLPEIISFGLLSALYLFFLGSAWIPYANGMKAPIWSGGMVWGPRYLSTLVPFGMILSSLVADKLINSQRRFVLFPLILVSLWIQIVGVSIPYLLQYRDLPISIFAGKHELNYYDYASFIPRFSPILTMSRELIAKIVHFPKTLDHGPFEVRFFDGFEVPLSTGNGAYRGFRQEGHVLFASKERNPVRSLRFSLYNAPDTTSGSSSAQLKFWLNGKPIGETQVQSEQTATVQFDVERVVREGNNILDLSSQYQSTASAVVVYISKLELDGTPVNLESLDYPEVSTVGDRNSQMKYQYFGNRMNDRWKLWYLRARITERTFDFWWVKNLYYWDRPQRALWILFLADLLTVAGSCVALRQLWTKEIRRL